MAVSIDPKARLDVIYLSTANQRRNARSGRKQVCHSRGHTVCLDSANVPWATCLQWSAWKTMGHGLVHQCLIHKIRTAPESMLLHTARAVPWVIICALLWSCSYTALSYCLFSTVPSSSGEAGFGFFLQDASLLQMPLKIFYSFLSEIQSVKEF